MSARKPLHIGIVGYGFMGRTHSNAFRQVNQFFDLPYEPVLKAACGRDGEKTAAFAAPDHLGVARDDRDVRLARGLGHADDDAFQLRDLETFLDEGAQREVLRHGT